MLDALDDAIDRRTVVLLDCVSPTVHSSSVAALASDLPGDSSIVLWGPDDEAWQEVALSTDEEGASWVRTDVGSDVAEVSAICGELLLA